MLEIYGARRVREQRRHVEMETKVVELEDQLERLRLQEELPVRIVNSEIRTH